MSDDPCAGLTVDMFPAGAELPYCLDPYGYGADGPALPLNAAFLALFALSFIVHCTQIAVARRYWWMLVMPVGLALEILGWSARVWSHFDLPSDGFIIQICVLVIAPTLFSAALYWAGGLVIQQVAPHRSRCMTPKWFKILFVSADVVSLVIQGIGGGMAGSAADDQPDQLETGSNIMLGGIIVQLVIMIFYAAYMSIWSFFSISELRRAGTRMQLMVASLGVSSIAIIIRGVYRTIELAQGFHGGLATDEPTILLDAIPIVVAVYTLAFIHPHWFLRVAPGFTLSLNEQMSQTTMVQPGGVGSPGASKLGSHNQEKAVGEMA
ncbi:hypothetical protein JCM6882_004756 [Rhodosporidiobolus microsporus]